MATRDEMDELFGTAMEFAAQMLEKRGLFHPFGVVMTTDGEVQCVAAGEDGLNSNDVIALLRDGMKAGAKSGEYACTAVAYDVLQTDPESGRKTDAIAVAIDHRDGESVVVFTRYAVHKKMLSRKRTVTTSDPTKTLGEGLIFRPPG